MVQFVGDIGNDPFRGRRVGPWPDAAALEKFEKHVVAIGGIIFVPPFDEDLPTGQLGIGHRFDQRL